LKIGDARRFFPSEVRGDVTPHFRVRPLSEHVADIVELPPLTQGELWRDAGLVASPQTSGCANATRTELLHPALSGIHSIPERLGFLQRYPCPSAGTVKRVSTIGGPNASPRSLTHSSLLDMCRFGSGCSICTSRAAATRLLPATFGSAALRGCYANSSPRCCPWCRGRRGRWGYRRQCGQGSRDRGGGRWCCVSSSPRLRPRCWRMLLIRGKPA
jgi:hypothetical protein